MVPIIKKPIFSPHGSGLYGEVHRHDHGSVHPVYIVLYYRFRHSDWG